PPRQVPPAGDDLPRPLPLPAGQARRQGAHPQVRRVAGGHPRAGRPHPRPEDGARGRVHRPHPARLPLLRVAPAGGREPGPLRRQLRRPALRPPQPALRAGGGGGAARVRGAAARVGAAGGGQAGPRRRAGPDHGLRDRPQALRAHQEGVQAGQGRRGAAADAQAGGLPVRRRVLERRVARLPGQPQVPLHRGDRPMRALALALAVSALPAAAQVVVNPRDINPLVSKSKEKEALLTKLKRDIFKCDKSILETEKLIAKSHSAPYLPDLQFRLAELYVEKSRYVYTLQAESRPEGMKGALISPETKLMKQKAQQLYVRLQKEYPDFHDGDKVTFYLAHEQRELGEFDEMLKTLGELIAKYPKSPLRLESEQILGDYYFDKADLVEAETHYQAVLEAPL